MGDGSGRFLDTHSYTHTYIQILNEMSPVFSFYDGFSSV